MFLHLKIIHKVKKTFATLRLPDKAQVYRNKKAHPSGTLCIVYTEYYPCNSAKYFSASIAAIHPLPAAVIACL